MVLSTKTKKVEEEKQNLDNLSGKTARSDAQILKNRRKNN